MVREIVLDYCRKTLRMTGSSGKFDIGTLSRITQKRLTGYDPLPEWTDDPTDASLRETQVRSPRMSHYHADSRTFSSIILYPLSPQRRHPSSLHRYIKVLPQVPSRDPLLLLTHQSLFQRRRPLQEGNSRISMHSSTVTAKRKR